jgi:hypothetical protein
MDDDWVTLECAIDWVVVYYAFPGELRDANGRTNAAENGVSLKEGVQVSLKMPDGTVLHEPLAVKQEKGHSTDHGGITRWVYEWFGFNLDLHGLKVWVPITDVEVLRTEMESLFS